jgi:urease accessory protein
VVLRRVDLRDAPLLRQEVRLGPGASGWQGPAVVAGAQAVGSLLLVDPVWAGKAAPRVVLGPTAMAVPLAGSAAQVTALAPSALALRAMLTEGEAALGLSSCRSGAGSPGTTDTQPP